jgi:hypothetical protein
VSTLGGKRERSKRCLWIRLLDGRLFRTRCRTRWAINVDYSSSSSLPESNQPFPDQVPNRAVSFPPSEQPTPVPAPPLPAGLALGCYSFTGDCSVSRCAACPFQSSGCSGSICCPFGGLGLIDVLSLMVSNGWKKWQVKSFLHEPMHTRCI